MPNNMRNIDERQQQGRMKAGSIGAGRGSKRAGDNKGSNLDTGGGKGRGNKGASRRNGREVAE